MRGILRWPRSCGQLRVRRATRARGGRVDAQGHARSDAADGDHRIVSAPAVVRREPGWTLLQGALGDSMFREQYLDAVACVINAQEAAGLDIVTDGDSRFDLAVGGKSWFFYPIERLGGIEGHRDTSRGWMQRHGLRPGKILWEVQEAYQPAVVKHRLTRGPLEYTALWKVAQRLTDRPVKFGAICAPALASMLWDEHYRDDKKLINDLSDIMNAEFRELAAAGCPLIQVEEPPLLGRTTRPDCTDADLEFLTAAFNRQLVGVDAEIWVHTCWGNPNQQRVYWETPSYERALPYLLA